MSGAERPSEEALPWEVHLERLKAALMEERIRDAQNRAALFECAKISGADVSDGPPTWPDIATWAKRCVQELRDDYDSACEELNP